MIGHKDVVSSVSFSPDARYFITGSLDGTSMLWDSDKGDWICKLISFIDGSWTVIDKYGRYDTNSPGDLPGLSWIMPDEPPALFTLRAAMFFTDISIHWQQTYFFLPKK
ncbi:MAG: hypothetical protein GY749_32960 [Desulfobacteraceae bacterium]|nr:hypothetical protein [Desulfobacteraceae bacterium]